MKNPIKLAAWTLLVAAALWISIVTVLNIAQPRHWRPSNPMASISFQSDALPCKAMLSEIC